MSKFVKGADYDRLLAEFLAAGGDLSLCPFDAGDYKFEYPPYKAKVMNTEELRFDPDSDDEYDYLKENWVLGDEPMTESQRRENAEWDEECRRNGW